jgi:hypothetical protein
MLNGRPDEEVGAQMFPARLLRICEIIGWWEPFFLIGPEAWDASTLGENKGLPVPNVYQRSD